MVALTLSYYPDITQGQAREAVWSAVSLFADALGLQLTADLEDEVRVTVKPVMEVPKQYAASSRAAHISACSSRWRTSSPMKRPPRSYRRASRFGQSQARWASITTVRSTRAATLVLSRLPT